MSARRWWTICATVARAVSAARLFVTGSRAADRAISRGRVTDVVRARVQAGGDGAGRRSSPASHDRQRVAAPRRGPCRRSASCCATRDHRHDRDYAKVDRTALSRLALPWPGSESMSPLAEAVNEYLAAAPRARLQARREGRELPQFVEFLEQHDAIADHDRAGAGVGDPASGRDRRVVASAAGDRPQVRAPPAGVRPAHRGAAQRPAAGQEAPRDSVPVLRGGDRGADARRARVPPAAAAPPRSRR